MISIITLLISILLPAFQQTRAAARGAVCLSNLRTMGIGWHMVIMENDGVIPYTYATSLASSTGYITWIDGLNDVFPQAPDLNLASVYGTTVTSFNACPQVQATNPPITYGGTNRWGYAINTQWQDAPNQYNDLHLWSAIRNPTAYPWLMDGELIVSVGNIDMTPRVPRERSATSWWTWGVGIYHSSNTTANVWFADGSARPTSFSEIDANVVGNGSYRWFEND